MRHGCEAECKLLRESRVDRVGLVTRLGALVDGRDGVRLVGHVSDFVLGLRACVLRLGCEAECKLLREGRVDRVGLATRLGALVVGRDGVLLVVHVSDLSWLWACVLRLGCEAECRLLRESRVDRVGLVTRLGALVVGRDVRATCARADLARLKG